MRQLLFPAIFLFLFHPASGQGAKNVGLIHHSISTDKLGTVNFYISDTLHERMKPLLVYLDGSGNQSLYYYKQGANQKFTLYSSIPFNLRKLALKYHILLISKPNTHLTDTVFDGDESIADSIYDKFAGADWRVESASEAINYILRHYRVPASKVAVFGYSEGGQVAPRLALYNKKVTHCLAFVGGGLNQFYEGIIRYRMMANKGEISQEEAQKNIDSLYTVYNAIYSNPHATDRGWFGHTYKRWSSYTSVPTIDYFVKLNIPVYLAQGTNDENSNVLSSDYIKLEFLRLGKSNLTYKTYPYCDHFFNDSRTHENRLDEVIDDAMKWLDEK